jgi:hypothetical protein
MAVLTNEIEDWQNGIVDPSTILLIQKRITTTTLLTTDLLAAADGIRSAVLQKICQSEQLRKEPPPSPIDMVNEAHQSSPTPSTPSPFGLHSMGVRLILGIANFEHPPLARTISAYTRSPKCWHRKRNLPFVASLASVFKTACLVSLRCIIIQSSFVGLSKCSNPRIHQNRWIRLLACAFFSIPYLLLSSMCFAFPMLWSNIVNIRGFLRTHFEKAYNETCFYSFRFSDCK